MGPPNCIIPVDIFSASIFIIPLHLRRVGLYNNIGILTACLNGRLEKLNQIDLKIYGINFQIVFILLIFLAGCIKPLPFCGCGGCSDAESSSAWWRYVNYYRVTLLFSFCLPYARLNGLQLIIQRAFFALQAWLSKSKSPAISASFLALDQPLTCLSRLNASW